MTSIPAYDAYLGRFWQLDGANQFASGYVGMGNMPTVGVDPDGQFVTWNIGNGGFSIGFNLTPIGIPLGAGINIGFKNGGSLGVYGELGVRVGGSGFGSGATLSQSIDYEFKGGWSTTTSAGAYASFGLLNAGGSASYSFSKQGNSFGWGVNAGIGFGNQQAGIGFNIGYGSSGWSYGMGGYYQSDKPKVNKVAEYNLKDASDLPMKQKGGYDCLVCAAAYIDQLSENRSYNEILAKFGSLYDPEKGTSTQKALESIYGAENVKAKGNFSPTYYGKEMELGNPVIIAQNNNHAIVPVKVEIFSMTYKYRTPKTSMNIRFMNPATGTFQNTGRVTSYKYPTFLIKIR